MLSRGGAALKSGSVELQVEADSLILTRDLHQEAGLPPLPPQSSYTPCYAGLKRQVFRRLLVSDLSLATDDVEPDPSVIGRAKMTMAPIGSEREEHVPGREFGNQGQFVVSRWWCEEMFLMQSLGTVLPPLLLYLLWLLPLSWTASEALTPVWWDELQNHTLLHTVFCQAAAPNLGLSETYDGDLLFSFNFDQTTRVPRLPEFAAWAQESQDISNILFDKVFCSMLVEQIGPKLEGKIPVSRGIPVAEVFTLKPLEFGKPNTLVCYISNLFPPTLTVNWQYNAAPVEGTGPTFISAVDGLSFQAFSYLNITPAASDLYSCIVTHEIDSYTAIAYWVPRNALPSDLLENVLCGVAFALGVLGILVGLSLIVYYQRPCSGG